ncbi:MAG: hypothetical protein QOI59_2641 [Gammaproteobacteria bacterium]|nr:hypothetical protein [Gammaproteobacteria bacterium]
MPSNAFGAISAQDGTIWVKAVRRPRRTHTRKRRSPGGLRHSLLEHYSIRTKATRPGSSAQQLHRSVHPLDPVARAALSLRASLYGLLASTRHRLTMNLATNQRAQRRDRTNVCMCHWITSFSCRGLIVSACRPPKPRAPI